MALIFLSFLGAGNYQPADYRWNGESSKSTYAQEAELKLLGEKPDRVLIFGTKTSREAHWEKCRSYDPRTKTYGNRPNAQDGLEPRLRALGYVPQNHAGPGDQTYEFVEISQDLSSSDQWGSFKQVLQHVDRGDRLILDITHGFRAVPVVFSSALHFLRLAEDVTLEHVLYGLHDADPPAIVDYVDFYSIQDWTDAVSRLVDEADARKLVALARSPRQSKMMPSLANEKLLDAILALTTAVRDVDVQNVAGLAQEALERIQSAQESLGTDSSAGRVLLHMLIDKFGTLLTASPVSGRYDEAYFDTQLELARLLLGHELHMQAFTVLREMIASFGEAGYWNKTPHKTSKKKRIRADVFLNMIQFEERPDPARNVSGWQFPEGYQEQVQNLTPFYRCLEDQGLVSTLRDLTREIAKVRNGFDHAWTSKRYDKSEPARVGGLVVEDLKKIIPVIFHHCMSDKHQ